MPRISRTLYGNAAYKLLEQVSSECEQIALCKFLILKNDRRIFIDVAGKNLPYLGSRGELVFEWETHIKPDRIDKIIHDSSLHKAESCLGFCYLILESSYISKFSNIHRLLTFE